MNFDERIGKVVGRRRPPKNTLRLQPGAIKDVLAWRNAIKTPFIPKGVFRFKSHKEADEWMWTMITHRKSL